MSDIQAEQPVEVPQEATPVEEIKQDKPDTSWVPRRISEITAARRAAEARVAELERENAELKSRGAPSEEPQPAPSSQSVDQLAKAYAERMVREQREQETLTQRIGEVNAAGTKEYGEEFDKSVQNLQMAGVGGPDFLRVLTNIPKPEAVVTWLGKPENLNEAMRMATLDPVQMAIEFTKLSSKASKELGKQISKAPPPIQPVEGRAGASDGVEPDPSDTQAWMAWRSKTKKTRR
ncbi:hypothetical protein C7410_115181 [Paraburkholderia silvatlantica]|uniref:Uncharacterized protein n=1 Tax=Paraburkholderia silvatlantica TaxID=321895 RepID=A0A2V4TJC4_9BURK|nr:hypothetical protein [Paraburkholderia silvatlantica]PYE21338.1 hypothetical protein C7410_115181 [Paraburkholderia silvatlantica]